MSTDTVKTLLNQLWHQGVEFWLKDDQLRFKGSKTVMNSDTIAQLREHKQAIIAHLEQYPDRYIGFPLSEGQRSIYLAQALAPNSYAYNQVCLLKLDDRLKTHLLHDSIRLLLERHPQLLVGFRQHQGDIAQYDAFYY